MKYSKNTSNAFTLVEIMIVVVIIGLLAAMAIPAFAKVRQNSVASKMDNDARQLASAAQQYFLETNSTTVTHGYNTTSGLVVSALSSWVKQLGKGYTVSATALDVSSTWSIAHPLVTTARVYNAEGQKQ